MNASHQSKVVDVETMSINRRNVIHIHAVSYLFSGAAKTARTTDTLFELVDNHDLRGVDLDRIDQRRSTALV